MRNDGDAEAYVFKVALDDDSSPNNLPIDTRTVPRLKPGQTITVNFDRKADSLNGYWFMADFKNDVEELTEENNSYHTVLSQADLVIETVTNEPEEPTIGQIVTWEALIRNDGLGNARDFHVAFDADSNPDLNPLKTIIVELLGPGNKTSVQFNRMYSSSEPDYWVMVDSQGTVSETNENNNVLRTTISITDPG